MTMEILGEVSLGADTMIKLPENASMTMQILDEVKDNERVPVQGLPTTYFLLIPFSLRPQPQLPLPPPSFLPPDGR